MSASYDSAGPVTSQVISTWSPAPTLPVQMPAVMTGQSDENIYIVVLSMAVQPNTTTTTPQWNAPSFIWTKTLIGTAPGDFFMQVFEYEGNDFTIEGTTIQLPLNTGVAVPTGSCLVTGCAFRTLGSGRYGSPAVSGSYEYEVATPYGQTNPSGPNNYDVSNQGGHLPPQVGELALGAYNVCAPATSLAAPSGTGWATVFDNPQPTLRHVGDGNGNVEHALFAKPKTAAALGQTVLNPNNSSMLGNWVAFRVIPWPQPICGGDYSWGQQQVSSGGTIPLPSPAAPTNIQIPVGTRSLDYRVQTNTGATGPHDKITLQIDQLDTNGAVVATHQVSVTTLNNNDIASNDLIVSPASGAVALKGTLIVGPAERNAAVGGAIVNFDCTNPPPGAAGRPYVVVIG